MSCSPRARVRALVIAVISCLAVACAFHGVMGVLGMGFPWNTFLFQPWDRLNDWHNTVAAAATLDPYFAPRQALSVYFPFTYWLLLVPAHFGTLGSALLFLTVSLGLLSLGVAAVSRAAVRPEASSYTFLGRGFAALMAACVLSYPMLFALDRGNLDAWIAPLCLIFVGTLRTRYAPAGLAALSVAIALKGYPAAFLGLVVADRRYGAAIVCLAIAVVANVLSLTLMDGGLQRNLGGLLDNLHLFRELYVLGSNSLFASSDPYNGLRFLWLWLHRDASPAAFRDWSEWLLGVYEFIALIFALFGAFFVLAVPVAAWRRVTATSLVILLFPNIANDYKLTLLLPGVLALALSGDSSRRAAVSFTLMCLLLVPKSYWFFDGKGVSMLVNPVLLVALASCVIADRRAWRAGRKLIRYRLVWHSASLGSDSAVCRLVCLGRSAPFLRRRHWSMHLT